MCMDSFVIVVVVMYLDKQTNKLTNRPTDRVNIKMEIQTF